MSNLRLVFEIHYGGRFNRTIGCEYVGGEVAVHTESVDPDELSYFELEAICGPYGYNSGDLIYFQEPGKSLAEGLHLITSDHNVLFLVASHKSDNIVHLFVVSFREDIADVEDCEEDDEDENVARADRNDPWWQDKLSDNEDIFDANVDDIDGGARPSKTKPNGSNVVECKEEGQHRDERGVEEGDDIRHDEPGEHDNGEGEGGDEDRGNDDDNEEGVDAVNQNEGGSSGCKFKTFYEDDDDDDDDDNPEMGRSDILESPVSGDEDCET
jgi:hypothetical protein